MNNKNKTVYVVGGDNSYVNWLGLDITRDFDSADVISFTGGSDVSSGMYGEKQHPLTSPYPERDKYEFEMFQRAISLNKYIHCTCRGSQFASMMAGGKIVQHINHPYCHNVVLYNGKTILSNSLHHQMMWPFNLLKEDYKILGWAEKQSPFHQGGNKEEMLTPLDPEIVYFPKIKCLGYQMHFEMLYKEPNFVESINEAKDIFDKFLNDEL